MSQLMQSARTAFTGLWADAVWGEEESLAPEPVAALPPSPVTFPLSDGEGAEEGGDTRH